jgi:hypothetical protein
VYALCFGERPVALLMFGVRGDLFEQVRHLIMPLSQIIESFGDLSVRHGWFLSSEENLTMRHIVLSLWVSGLWIDCGSAVGLLKFPKERS